MLTAAQLIYGTIISYLAFSHNLEIGFFAFCLPSIKSILHREIKVIFQNILKWKSFQNNDYIIFLRKTPLAFHPPNSFVWLIGVWFWVISPDCYHSCCFLYPATWIFAIAKYWISLFLMQGPWPRLFPSAWGSVLSFYLLWPGYSYSELRHHFHL